jgi:hypothetical protein
MRREKKFVISLFYMLDLSRSILMLLLAPLATLLFFFVSLQQNTLLGRVHGRAGLALEGLGKVVRVLDHAVDAPLLGRVVVVVEHLDGLLGGHVAAVRARVLDKEQLISGVLLQTRQLVVVVPFETNRD